VDGREAFHVTIARGLLALRLEAGALSSLVSRLRSSPVLQAGLGRELRNHKGQQDHLLASVVQIEKFTPRRAANSGAFLDHH
jgi:hypothetical protein